MINMQAISTHTLATALALAVATTLTGQVRAGSERVKFPESYTAGMLYVTADRGDIKAAAPSSIAHRDQWAYRHRRAAGVSRFQVITAIPVAKGVFEKRPNSGASR